MELKFRFKIILFLGGWGRGDFNFKFKSATGVKITPTANGFNFTLPRNKITAYGGLK